MNSAETTPIEFIGIYDADSTLVGEISYWIGARLGRAHCSLCELTHGLFTKKNEWKTCQSSLSVPFLTYHRDDAPPEALHVANGEFPVVLARYQHGIEVAITAHQLDDLHGNTRAFEDLLHTLLTKN